MVHRVLTWLLLLLTLLFTIDLVVSHTRNIYTTDGSRLGLSRSIKILDGNSNSSFTPLSRSKRLAIYNGQGIVKVGSLYRSISSRSSISTISTIPVGPELSVSRETGRQGPILLVVFQHTGPVDSHHRSSLLVELLEHHRLCVHSSGVAQGHAGEGFARRGTILGVQCHRNRHGAVSLIYFKYYNLRCLRLAVIFP